MNLDDLVDNIIEWQRKTFPKTTMRSTINHLASELGEAIAFNEGPVLRKAAVETAKAKLEVGSYKKSTTIESEIADLFVLLVQLADCAGVNLTHVVELKMMENKQRNWKAPDRDGVVEHK